MQRWLTVALVGLVAAALSAAGKWVEPPVKMYPEARYNGKSTKKFIVF